MKTLESMRLNPIYSDHTDTSLCVLASALYSYKHRKFMDMTAGIIKSAVLVIFLSINNSCTVKSLPIGISVAKIGLKINS
jgi:hypothetical protein